MDVIKVDVRGVVMSSQNDQTFHLVLIALNEMWADILQHTLDNSPGLRYIFNWDDITYYLVFELPDIDKIFSVPVNSTTKTRNWLCLIDEKKVTKIRIAFRDGKGGIKPFGCPVSCTINS